MECPLYGVSAIWGVRYREVSAIEGCPLYWVSAILCARYVGVRFREVSDIWGVRYRDVSAIWGVLCYREVSAI